MKCPFCGEEHYIEGISTATAVDCPEVIKDGRVINKAGKTTTQIIRQGRKYPEDENKTAEFSKYAVKNGNPYLEDDGRAKFKNFDGPDYDKLFDTESFKINKNNFKKIFPDLTFHIKAQKVDITTDTFKMEILSIPDFMQEFEVIEINGVKYIKEHKKKTEEKEAKQDE